MEQTAEAPATTGRRGRHGHHGKLTGRYKKEEAARDNSREKTADVDDKEERALEAQAAAEAQPRMRNYALLANAYSLYDQGVNERLKGNYGLSTDKLTEAVKLIDQASSIARDGRPSTLTSMVFFELGQSAEADGDLSLARDSYVHAVKAKPDYVEAYLRLVNVLAQSGKVRQALNWLKDGLREMPHEPRLNAMLTQLGGFMGDEHNSGLGNDMSVGEDEDAVSARKGAGPTGRKPTSPPDLINETRPKTDESPVKEELQPKSNEQSLDDSEMEADKAVKGPEKSAVNADKPVVKEQPTAKPKPGSDENEDPGKL